MKKIFYLTLIMLLTVGVQAQIDRSIRPTAGPAPKIQLGDYEFFTLENGLKVIVVENHKVPKITYQLSLDIDPILEGNHAGYVSMAGELLRSGTHSKSKAEIDEAIDFIGASLNTYSTGISGSVLTKHSNEFLDIMSDVLFNPTFPAEELDKLKKQSISGIQAGKNEANAIASNINSIVTYGKDHPYGEIISEKSIESINIDQCKEYYQTYFKPNVAYLIIVGDITLKEARSQTNKYFSGWVAEEVPTHQYEFPGINTTPRVVIGNRDGAVQSVIMVSFPLDYKPGNPDAIKGSVLNTILGGGGTSTRINANLREDKAYTYGGYSSLSTDKIVGAFNASAEVKGEATDSAMYELLYEIKRMIEEPVDVEELEKIKSKMNGSFARSLENPSTIANFVLNIKKYNLPEDYYSSYLEKLSQVSVQDIQEVAAKYLKPDQANIIAVGNAEQLKQSMKRFSVDGMVEELDYYGNPVQTSAVPAGLTGLEVVGRYIEAIGGRDKLEEIQDITINSGMSMQGMNFEINIRQKAPNKMLLETLMGGNVMSKQVFNGEKAQVTSPMGSQELSGSDLEEMKIQSTLNLELYFNEMGFKVELKGAEDVDGKPAWKVQLTKPSGQTSVVFYDQKNGLKLKSVSQQGQMTITTVYSDYREVDGILFPFTSKQSVGPQSFDVITNSIKINTGLDDKIFEF